MVSLELLFKTGGLFLIEWLLWCIWRIWLKMRWKPTILTIVKNSRIWKAWKACKQWIWWEWTMEWACKWMEWKWIRWTRPITWIQWTSRRCQASKTTKPMIVLEISKELTLTQDHLKMLEEQEEGQTTLDDF